MPSQPSFLKLFKVLLRTCVALASGLTGYLALFRPPAWPFWFLRIGVTEWGYWLAPLAFLPLARPLRRVIGWPAWLLGAAASVAQLPLLQALLVARALPARLAAAFSSMPLERHGAVRPRPAPLVPRDLVRGIGVPPVPYQRMVYAHREDGDLSLDFYQPLGAQQPAPLVVVIHGGAWRGGDSQQLPALNWYLASRGYAVASISYRLMPRAHFPAAQEDLAAALDYLQEHANQLGIDSERIVLLGRSAGAQIALLAAYSLHMPSIRGVISFYGPTDLVWGYRHPANPLVIDTCTVLEQYLGGSPEEVPDVYTAASPITFVDASSPPTLLIHGGKDEMVYLRNSKRLVARLEEVGRPHLLVALPWAAHGCDANLNGPSGQISTYAIEYFLHAVLPQTKAAE